ncbi:uncharacterized protein UDID_17706 [Ustilago sp. UG-2017a]|nr:uncharacterized protein UDID_17706 [Ustilago sp. UG-2017a]
MTKGLEFGVREAGIQPHTRTRKLTYPVETPSTLPAARSDASLLDEVAPKPKTELKKEAVSATLSEYLPASLLQGHKSSSTPPELAFLWALFWNAYCPSIRDYLYYSHCSFFSPLPRHSYSRNTSSISIEEEAGGIEQVGTATKSNIRGAQRRAELGCPTWHSRLRSFWLRNNFGVAVPLIYVQLCEWTVSSVSSAGYYRCHKL